MSKFKVGDTVIDETNTYWEKTELAKYKNIHQVVVKVTPRVYLDSGIDFDPGSMYGVALTVIPVSILDSYYNIIT